MICLSHPSVNQESAVVNGFNSGDFIIYESHNDKKMFSYSIGTKCHSKTNIEFIRSLTSLLRQQQITERFSFQNHSGCLADPMSHLHLRWRTQTKWIAAWLEMAVRMNQAILYDLVYWLKISDLFGRKASSRIVSYRWHNSTFQCIRTQQKPQTTSIQ